MKQSIILVLAAALCLSLFAGCGSAPAQSPSGEAGDSGYDSITLTMAVNGTDTQIDTRVANYFKELVEEETQGSVVIEVYPNDQLAGGNATKGIEMIADGSTDLAAYATSVLSVLDERLSIGTIPWMFNNYTEAGRPSTPAALPIMTACFRSRALQPSAPSTTVSGSLPTASTPSPLPRI